MSKQIVKTDSTSQTEAAGYQFAGGLKPGDTVAFTGELGAGKTAFVRGAVRYLVPTAHSSSPSYTLVNEYIGTDVTVYHMDLYRIEGEDDLYSTGFYDYLEAGGICFIEWSERAADELPQGTIFVDIKKTGEHSREITWEV